MNEYNLSKIAMRSNKSRSLKNRSSEANIFLEDRDRILQSKGFRRLGSKTQVFVNYAGDHYRNRLTHSLEVASTAKTICRALNINEDLAECIGLAHDLGHAPFGHCGQDILDLKMKKYSGFEHNFQSVRIVTEIEESAFGSGLNLSFEAVEGIIKHREPESMIRLGKFSDYDLDKSPSLEAQVANFSDELTYNCHDMDDGFRSGILTKDDLMTVTLFKRVHDSIKFNNLTSVKQEVLFTINRIKKVLIDECIEETRLRIKGNAIHDYNDVVLHKTSLVGFNREMTILNGEIKKFLYKNLYFSPDMETRNRKSAMVISGLFSAFTENYKLLPKHHILRYEAKMEKHGDEGGARAICDYISGMTDGFSEMEYRRLHYI